MARPKEIQDIIDATAEVAANAIGGNTEVARVVLGLVMDAECLRVAQRWQEAVNTLIESRKDADGETPERRRIRLLGE